MPFRFIERLFRPILKIKPSEWPRALLAFLYFFFVITSYYIIKPVRDSLFIGQHGAADLPKAKLLTFAVLTVLVFVMLRLVNVLKKNIYLSSCVAFSVIVLIAFWWLSATPHFWVAYAFYVWVSIYSVLNVSLFWTSASDIFDVQEAKRLFGFVGSGGILGGVVGSYITSQLAVAVGTRGLLLTAAFLLSFCVLIINWLWSLGKNPEYIGSFEPKDFFRQLKRQSAWEWIVETVKVVVEIFRNRYLFIVLTLFALAKMVSTIVDYQFKNLVTILPQDQMTVFFAHYNLQINVASFAIQFFLTSIVLRKMGVISALFLLPIGVGTGSLGILIHPELWVGRITSIYDKGMSYSLNQTTREVLYLPVDRETRYRVKPVIDLVGFRLADAMGNLLILVLTRRLMLNVRQLSLASLVLVVVWFFAIWIMKGDYSSRLRSYLSRGPIIEKGNLLGRSFVLLFASLLESMGKLHKNEQHFLLRAFNLGRRSETAARIKEKIKGGASAENGPPVIQAFEEERGGKIFDDELQELLESGQVEMAGSEVAFLTRFRTRSAKRLMGVMRKSSYASIRLAGLWVESAYGEGDLKSYEENEPLIQEIRFEEEEQDKVISEIARRHAPTPEMAENFVDLAHRQTKENLERHTAWIAEGGWTIPAILDCVNEPRIGMEYRYGLPLVLSLIHSLQSIQALEKLLAHRNSTVRLSALKALNKLRVAASDIRFDEPRIEYELHQTVLRWRSAYRTMTVFRMYSRLRRLENMHEDHFLNALGHRLNDLEERIFRLLGLLCDCEDSFQIYNALQQTDAQLRANAIELLEHILPLRLRPLLLQILDPDLTGDSNAEEMEKTEAEEHIRSMLPGVSRWNGLSALTLIMRFDLDGFDEEIKKLTETKDPILRHVASAIAEELAITHARY